jgi:glycogen operon protein
VITLSTAPGVVAADPPTVDAGALHTVPARSVLVLQRIEAP